MDIKPIDTLYSGHYFRSRLEARWAVYLDALGVKWIYEPEGYEFSGHKYLPDFFLPELDVFVEIKPDIDIREDFERWQLFSAAIKKPLLLLYGLPSLKTTYLIRPEGGKVIVTPLFTHDKYAPFYYTGEDVGIIEDYYYGNEPHTSSIEKAQMERF